MQPYVIKQGDYLAKLAYTLSFDADTVWNDDKNADLRKLRPDPNFLWPTDVLYIPDSVDQPPAMQSLTTGSANNFVSDAPTTSVSIRFSGAPLASQPYTVQELPQLTGLTTGGDGTATFSIPITLERFTIAFTASGATFTFDAGHLDPLNTLSGVVQRLQNLGYIAVDYPLDDPPDLELLRAALRAFKADQGGPSSAPAPGPAAPAPAPSSPPSANGSPSSAGPASSPTSSLSTEDNAGMSDDGTLDDATSQLLLGVHLS